MNYLTRGQLKGHPSHLVSINFDLAWFIDLSLCMICTFVLIKKIKLK
jgi:hypothetical protein